MNKTRITVKRQQKQQRHWRRNVSVLLVIILLADVLFSCLLIQYAMVRKGGPAVPAASGGGERVTIQSGDGLQLAGAYLDAGRSSHKWVILVHGYHSSKELMLAAMGERYQQQGYHVLAIDQRAHGESQGKFIGMGWLERKDLLRWMQWVTEQDPEARIALHGISMGAATVMMAAGDAQLPEQVKVAVEDCSYTSALDIFSYQLRSRFHLPASLVLPACVPIAKVWTGVDLQQASALKQIKQSALPVLFIHGTADAFVPVDMVYPLYEAAGGEKELLLVEGGAHALSRQANPELYYQRVFEFLQKYM